MTEESAAAPPLFAPLTAILVVLVGVFAFCALLVLATYASSLESGDNGQGHALSKSAVGFSGLAEALKILRQPVLISRHRLPRGRAEGLYVLTPPPSALDKDVTPMGFAGPTLVVLPKWLTAPDLKRRGWVSAGAPLPPGLFGKESLLARAHVSRRGGVSRPLLTAKASPFVVGQSFAAGPIDSLQTASLSAWKGWTPVLTDESGGVILAKAPYGPVYLLSDPDLLNNQGIKNYTTFASGVAIVDALRADAGPVIFDVTLNGLGRRRGALNLLFDPPFLAVTLCLAAAALLAGVQAFSRFGPILTRGRAVAHGKTALADNSAALVRLAGKESAMGAPYAALIRDLTARAVGAPRGLSGEELVAFLDRLGARRGTRETLGVLTLLAGAAADRARLVVIAAKLHHWRTEMTGER